ncbi:MAG: hypothetical protein ACR5KV_08410 [Wolbachia sp.]
MAAARSKSALGVFYSDLIGRGKKKMVAITALMRKIIVIANARLKEAVNVNFKICIENRLMNMCAHTHLKYIFINQ